MSKDCILEILEHALKFEKENGKFYKDHAEKTTNSTAKDMLNFLSDEENKHVKIVENLIESYETEAPSKGLSTKEETLKEVKDIFKQLTAHYQSGPKVSEDVMEILEFALDIEKKGAEFYYNAKRDEANKKVAVIFDLLGYQEEEHYNLILNTLNYFKDPDGWNAWESGPVFSGMY